MDFQEELKNRGAREYQVVSLSTDEDRAMAAIAEAERRGVNNVIPYACTLFNDTTWNPAGEKPRRVTNASVEVRCSMCNGDRFVVHSTRAPHQTGWMKDRGITPSEEPIEEMKPCPTCNPGEIVMWRWDGTRVVTPK